MFQFGRKSDNKAQGEIAPIAAANRLAKPPLSNGMPAPEGAASSSAADIIRDEVLTRIEPAVAVHLTKTELGLRVDALVATIANEQRLLLNQAEQHALAVEIVDEMVGLGPLEPLLRDPTVNDILVNGPFMTFVERRGKLELTQLRFRNN